jgi:hypothetical protein
MIDINQAWNQIEQSAQKALITDMLFHSLKEGRSYKVLRVEKEKLILKRVSSGQNSTLTKNAVLKAIQRWNDNKGKPMRRRGLIEKPVIKETTLVLFHPQLTWDETGNFIIEI